MVDEQQIIEVLKLPTVKTVTILREAMLEIVETTDKRFYPFQDSEVWNVDVHPTKVFELDLITALNDSLEFLLMVRRYNMFNLDFCDDTTLVVCSLIKTDELEDYLSNVIGDSQKIHNIKVRTFPGTTHRFLSKDNFKVHILDHLNDYEWDLFIEFRGLSVRRYELTQLPHRPFNPSPNNLQESKELLVNNLNHISTYIKDHMSK